MAAAVDQVYDFGGESQSSDSANERCDSPIVKRHCSEPAHALQGLKDHPIATSLSPPPSINQQIHCPWCSTDLDVPDDGVSTQRNVLKEHLALMHSQHDELPESDIHKKEFDTDINMEDSEAQANGQGISFATTNDITTVTAPATDAESTPELTETTPDAYDLNNATTDLKRNQIEGSGQGRLLQVWNLHDVRKFNPIYERTTADLEHQWSGVFNPSEKTKTRVSVKVPPRPNPYLTSTTEKGDFLKVTPVEKFLDMVQDFERMPTDELNAVSSNIAHALKTWQDEWLAIEQLNRRVSDKPARKNPRALERHEVFEDKKEAALYGYKYDPTIHDPKKRDSNNEFMFRKQDPFIQGGFRPTGPQLRAMQAKVDSNDPNPDGFKTMTKYGQEYVPRFQNPPLYPFEAVKEKESTGKKRKVPSGEVEALKQASAHDSSTPVLDSDIDGQPFKRVTRSALNKSMEASQTPPFHDAAEVKSLPKVRVVFKAKTAPKIKATPKAKTAPSSPAPQGGEDEEEDEVLGRGRGGTRGRGRPTTTKSSKSIKATTSTAKTTEEAINSAPPLETQAGDGTPSDQSSATATESASTAPTPKLALAPATPGAPPALAALPPNLVQPGEVVDQKELKRRRLVAKSKNPRRTLAMLDHWQRFIKEGRTRNPKRTKAQIEADKQAEAERKAKEAPKPPATKTRKRKATSADADEEPGTKHAKAVAAASIQPAPVQPTVAPIAPTPAIMTLSQPHLALPTVSAPPRTRSPQGYLGPHASAPAVAAPQPQPTRALQPVLPGFERNAAAPLWGAPSPYYHYANAAPPYPSYGHNQLPPPQVNALHRHDSAAPEMRQTGPAYPFDAIRPVQHLQNGPPVQRP